MSVIGEGFDDVVFFHHDERNAIDQSPAFIASGSEQFKSTIEKIGIKSDNLDFLIR